MAFIRNIFTGGMHCIFKVTLFGFGFGICISLPEWVREMIEKAQNAKKK